MRPVLEVVSDGGLYRHGDLAEAIVGKLDVSDDDQSELLPSGIQSRFENRLRWAKWYLTRAGLLESVSHGVFRITERGREVLGQSPSEVSVRYLQQQGYLTQEMLKGHGETGATVEQIGSSTPDEELATVIGALREVLASELLDRVKQASPRFFEQVVVDLLVAMGYGGSRLDAGKAVGRSGDGGIDGIIKEDKLGLDVVYVQAKRWSATVGRPDVQAFAGSLEGVRARKGVMITTSAFTKDARDYVGAIEKKIILIDGKTLTEYMIDHGVGVNIVQTYLVRQIDEDYFEGASGIPTSGGVS